MDQFSRSGSTRGSRLSQKRRRGGSDPTGVVGKVRFVSAVPRTRLRHLAIQVLYFISHRHSTEYAPCLPLGLRGGTFLAYGVPALPISGLCGLLPPPSCLRYRVVGPACVGEGCGRSFQSMVMNPSGNFSFKQACMGEARHTGNLRA